MAESQNKFCFVQFKLCQRTYPGEDIHITGNTPSLGLWNVYKSEKMVTNQADYPLWKSKESIIVQQDTEIQYKYLIFRGGKFIRWENNNDNRKVKVGKYCKIVVMDPGSKIVHCVSDPNLNNITNSEISKCDNNFYEDDSKFTYMEEIDFNSIDMFNNDIFSEQNLNINNNEEQFILSNKKNDLFFDNKERKLHILYEDLNVDNSNQSINNNESNNNLNHSNINLNKMNSIENIVNDIEPINNQIFNNIIVNENKNQKTYEQNDLNLCKIDSNISEIEIKNSEDTLPFIENDSSKNELILIKKNNSIYQKIIVCSLFLPVEIYEDEIIPLNDYLYPNLYNLKKYNDNIYYIGLLKNEKNINQENKEKIYNKLKKEYKMYPIEIDSNLKNELFSFFNDIIKPYLNNIKINIYNLINKNIYTIIYETLYKFNKTMGETIIELCGKEKSLILLFEYYFIFVPFLLKIGDENDISDNLNKSINIEYIFSNQIPTKEKFIDIPNYQKMIKSMLCCDLVCFPLYNNCFKFLNIMKLFDDIEYQANIEGDIVLTFNTNLIDNNKDSNNSKSLSSNMKSTVLKVENIFPDYNLLKYILDETEKEENLKFLSIKEKIENLSKKENYFIFLSIDDINYLSFIKIKLSGLKVFIDDALDEKQKIIFIQIITGEPKNKNNILNNININEEKQEKENLNELDMEEIKGLYNEINSLTEDKIIEIFYNDINIYEKIYLLNKADCFIKTTDDINSPLSIYEYLMVKLIGFKNQIEKNINNLDKKNSFKINNNKYKINKIIEKGQEFPIIEYIISSQVKEVPGINKYIYINPFEIKSISNGLTKAYRNLVNYHKNTNNINFMEEHTKENDFNYIKSFFGENKFQGYKFNTKDYQNNNPKNNNIINNTEQIKLNKIDINNIIKDYSESIKNNLNKKDNNNTNKSNINIEIIVINLDFFLSNYSTKKETEENQKLSELFSNLISLSIHNVNNKIILFSKEDQFDLDDILLNYIKQDKEKFKDINLNKITNLIIASSDGYSFKKFCNYFEEEDINNNWIKILIDSEELKYSEKDIINNLLSYKQNCINLKIEHKSNKIYIYNDNCNKEQIDIYMDCFKNEIEGNETLKHILVVNKISNGYCIVNTMNCKAPFISRLIKEIISKENYPKFILYLGFNKSDEILYKYLDEKKGAIEKYSNTDIYVYCIKLINSEEHRNENNGYNNIEENHKNLFYEDNIDEIISLFKRFIDLQPKNS